MAIVRPTTKTLISTTNWGIPITDEVNRLTTLTGGNVPTAWTPLTLLNGWLNYGGSYDIAQYRKIGDIVQIRGVINSGTIGSPAFNLPSGFRPLKGLAITVAATGISYNPPIIAINPDPDGNAVIYDATNAVIHIGLLQFSRTA